MSNFSDDFRSVFPDHASDVWVQQLGRDLGVHQTYQAVRYLPSVALLHPVSTAISRVRSTVDYLNPGDLLEGVSAIEALVAVADVIIESDAEVRPRSRELAEMLLRIANVLPPTLQQVRAHAAVIHARADDRTLAVWRINEYLAEPPPPERAIERWNGSTPPDLLVAYAQRLLGLEAAPAPGPEIPPDPTGASNRAIGHADASVWSWLAGFRADPGIGELKQVISEAALQSPDATFTSLVNALTFIPRIVGFSIELANRGAPLLVHAEELLWLAHSSRGLLWSQLSLAAASQGDMARAQRCTSNAFEAISDNYPPDIRELIDLAANLLQTQALASSGLAMTEPPSSVLDTAVGAGKPGNSAGPAVIDPLPDALGDTLTSGNVLLVAGPELPAARGAPGRTELLRSLVQRTNDQSTSEAGRQQVLVSITQGNLDLAARLLRARQDGLEARVAEVYAVPPAAPVYDALAQIPFVGIVNMNWDSSLLDAFMFRSPVVIHAGSDQALTAAKSQEFSFTWYAGDPDHEQIAIGPREVRARLYADETLSRFLTGIVQSSSLLFVGVRAADIIDFFEALPASSGAAMSPTAPAVQRRFAICAIDELWELNRSQLGADFGVELIGYHPAEAGALATIVQRLSYLGRPVGADTDIPAQPLPSPAGSQILSRVTLTNIGAFEQLDLKLGEAWNLLLGNNGCGKSTVLRAVALGLCGDHPMALEAGQGLLRTGCDKGLIELQVGSSRFRTELHRATGTVRVRTSSLAPLQQGNWVVLGFPALRGTSLTTPTGISHSQAPEPKVEDLLPLLRNEVDHRLDDIKQWIINVEARTRQSGGERSRELLNRFFSVLGELTPGVKVQFEAVDPTSWEVWVRTDDGVVSIDQLSQGMSSIIAWVGTLLQRMYDIYGDCDEPAAETAFVLIDELDAHLHPVWQRLLPSLTREHFPRVQFLATSHSPLVASSLRPGELFVATREPRADLDGTEHLVAAITAAEIDPQGLRADQVLTSPLFGLMTSRSPEFGNEVDRYSHLMTAGSRTADEEAEMQRLRSAIAASYRDGETATEREAEARQDAELEQALADVELNEQNVAALRKLTDSLDAVSEEGET